MSDKKESNESNERKDSKIKEVLKTHKKSILFSEEDIKLEVIPTSSFQLDVALGIGGFPRGRITTIAGQEASGKSTLCYNVIVESQKLGLNPVLINAECVFDPYRAEALGIDLKKLIVVTPKDFETASDVVCEIADTGEADVIIFDSLVGAPLKALNEGSVEDHNVGRKAKLLGNFLAKVTGPVARNNVALILINQFRASMAMYGANYLMPGGYALTYASSLIIYLFGAVDKEGGEFINVRAKVKKNNLAIPFREVTYALGFDGKIDNDLEIATILTDPALGPKLGVEQFGSWYQMKEFLGESKVQGAKQVAEMLRSDNKLSKSLEAHIRKTLTR